VRLIPDHLSTTVPCMSSLRTQLSVIFFSQVVIPYVHFLAVAKTCWPAGNSSLIKLCHSCVLLLYCSRDLDIKYMTLKLEGDNRYSENTPSHQKWRHSKLLTLDDISMVLQVTFKKTKITFKVKCHQLPTTSGVHHGTKLHRFPTKIVCTDRRRQKQYLLTA